MSPVIRNDTVASHFNSLADEYENWKDKASYYYGYVMSGLREVIPPGKRVLELGCGTGAILDSLQPSYGLGVDLSAEMVEVARKKRPQLHFQVGDIERLRVSETFDYVVMVDLVEHLSNLTGSVANLKQLFNPETIGICSSANPLWAPILHLAENLKLKMPEGDHRWPSAKELEELLKKEDFEVLKTDYRMILPKKVPVLSDTLNAAWPKQGALSKLALIQMIRFRTAR